jgi:hypothetical protein
MEVVMGFMLIFNAIAPVMLALILILSVLYFLKSPWFRGFADKINGPGLIKYIKSKYQVILRADVPRILSRIEAERLVPSRKTTRAHPNHVKEIIEAKQNSDFSPKYSTTTAFSSNDDALSHGIDTEPAFIDSWEDRSWQTDDIQFKFTDRTFQ